MHDECPTHWQEPSPEFGFSLEPGELHVWRAALQGSSATLDLGAWLSAEELARAFRFRFAPERTSYIACRGILRQLLGAYLRIAPAKIAFAYNPFGKPELAGQLAKSALCFNLSHSHEMVLFAFVRARQIGIDVEKILPNTIRGELAEGFLAPPESARLRSLPATERATAFFECWTRKEAYLKASGEGLIGGLESFEVSFGHGAAPAILRPKKSIGPTRTWSVMNLSVGPDYAGALVVEGARPGLTCFQWTPALLETLSFQKV